MKTIYKLLSLVFILTVSVSCDRDQGDSDYLNGRGSTIFYSSPSGTLFVEEGAANNYQISVATTAIQNSGIPYSIEVDPSSTAVEGVDFDFASSTQIPGGNIVSTFSIEAYFDNASLDGKTLVLNLVGSEGVDVGTNNTFSLDIFKSCPYNGLNTTDYSAAVVAFDAEAPSYDVTLVPVAGSDNQWTVTTGWGPSFVAWATGDPQYEGAFLYSGTITLNSDFSVDFAGDDAWADRKSVV